MNKLKLLLIEDNPLLREGIKVLLAKQKDMRCVETVGNGENILNLLQQHKPHIVLLDLGLRNRNSLNLVKIIKKKNENAKIIVMDLIPAQEDVLEFVQEGVSGFTLKDISVNDFLKTIRSVAKDFNVIPPNLTGSLFSQIVEHALKGSNHSDIMDSVTMTKRENQVIGLISKGYTNKEIAQELHLSTFTIKSHVHNILEKLALSTRVQISKYVHNARQRDSASKGITLIDE